MLLTLGTSRAKATCKLTQQLPTLLAQQCWELLRPCWQWCANGLNNQQHCWANNVGSCCVRLYVAKSLTGFKLGATTRNRVWKRTLHVTGAPNENIVQNHLNIALLNVFQSLNSGYGHIFIPYKFFICSDFLAESLVIRKLQGSKLTRSKILARKKAPENFR